MTLLYDELMLKQKFMQNFLCTIIYIYTHVLDYQSALSSDDTLTLVPFFTSKKGQHNLYYMCVWYCLSF